MVLKKHYNRKKKKIAKGLYYSWLAGLNPFHHLSGNHDPLGNLLRNPEQVIKAVLGK